MGSKAKILLNDSMNICRLCGKEQNSKTISIYERSETNEPNLKEEISFFLPIQVDNHLSNYIKSFVFHKL